jgi:redox-sensitive bicupin YhaK (pirin superfamily)
MYGIPKVELTPKQLIEKERTDMKTLSIAGGLTVQSMKHGSGFSAQGIRGETAVLDPYLMADHFRMSQPTFGPHPHAGFAAVTYLFDDAETGFHNRDSLGDSSVIRAGDLHWTTAGSGVVHDEVPVEAGKTAHGLQIFVNLAASRKHMNPGAIHVERERMPRFTQSGGAQVKVPFGGYDDGTHAVGPAAEIPADVTLLDVQLTERQHFAYPVPPGQTAFLLVIEGALQVNGERIGSGQAVAFQRSEERASVEVVAAAATGNAQFVLFMGQPLGEPVVRRGPFAMTNEADLDRAAARYAAGQMGSLPIAAAH